MPGTRRVRPEQSLLLSSILCLAALLPASSWAGALPFGWNESVQGDLSGDGLAPTVVAVGPGINNFQGLSGRSPTTDLIDRDYFAVTVPAGYELSAMLVREGTVSIGSGSFIGVMNGSTFSVSPTSGSAAGMLGWTIFGEGNVGADLLSYMSAPALGSSGFTPPLPAGNYSFWVQENGIGVSTYAFSMEITPAAAVPEPATVLTLLAGLALVAGAIRRR